MYKTIVIDDEPLIRESIKQILEPYKEIMIIGACGSVAEGETLIKSCEPDLVFLDIQLLDGTGFDLLKKIEEINFKLVFVTSYDKYAINAIKYGAFDYILKPIDDDEFDETLQRLFKEEQKTGMISQQQIDVANNSLIGKNRRITLRLQDHFQLINFDDIQYCKSDGGYTTFFLSENRKVMVSKSLAEYEKLLPSYEFIRSHQSYIVNISFIEKLTKEGFLVLKNGANVPVSVRKKEEVVRKLT